MSNSTVTLPTKYITFRSYRKFDEDAFRDDLEKATWNVLEMYHDPDDALDFFNDSFLSIADFHALLVMKLLKR